MIIDSPPYRLITEPPVAPTLPSKGQSFTDPNFGTRIVRVTDETDGTVCRISYGIWPALSCDYSKILIQCDALFKIVTWNPATMDGWGEIALPANFQGSDATWSHTDPDSIYHRDGGSRLMLLNVVTGTDTVIHDFAADFPASPFLARMSSSSNDDIWCFSRQTTDYAFAGFLVYTISTGALYSEPPERSTEYLKLQIDKSGRWMWNIGAVAPNSEWWDLSLPNTQKTVLTPGTGHSAVLTSKIAQYDNNTNADMLGPFGAMNAPAIKWPDWTLEIEYSGTANDDFYAVVTNTLFPAGVLHDELLQVAADGSGSVRRLCHLYNVIQVTGTPPVWEYASESQPATGYGACPFILFHSSWGNSGRRDVFLVNTMATTPVIAGISKQNYVIVYGSGIVVGSVEPTVTIGGVVAPVTYAGKSGDGTQDQINVEVPASLIGSCNQAVVVTVGGIESNSFEVVV